MPNLEVFNKTAEKLRELSRDNKDKFKNLDDDYYEGQAIAFELAADLLEKDIKHVRRKN